MKRILTLVMMLAVVSAYAQQQETVAFGFEQQP
jgi:hypothetical protein